ncbi:DNA-binding protein [Pseudomaricurvus alcaniphilus]|uniref:Zn-ribbon domain-containing OB-fold protein n=1 Tax=Pseudomaricurvus alcaniphilus TaxID=1166482 RepID=UPI00140C2A52|nr:OB-fold domain-containing protein [Pseudomaricurvus alcaniphilus]NHN39219.1 DNA-binding protein [Pseudomaricurvus alcaniphilus]
MSEQIPIHKGLFTWPSSRPQLLGSRCKQCGETAFPAQVDCRSCSGRDTEVVELGDRGTLWTWTIQTFMPKQPYHSDETEASFRPYGVGYVEMPGGVRVEARLEPSTREQLAIGMPMQLNIVPFRTDASGNQIMTFSFSAVEEDQAWK